MIKISDIAVQLKKYNHSKKELGDILMAQFREFIYKKTHLMNHFHQILNQH